MIHLWHNDLATWMAASLTRKVALMLAVTLTIASFCFLAILVISYRNRVLEERSLASTEVNHLLQVGLENAMLSRDIDGLRSMVNRLGKQDNIAGVMILSPQGEVRFASKKEQLGRRYDLSSDSLCPNCRETTARHGTLSAFLSDPETGDVLRSINPVRNRKLCTQCHGSVASNPINGILVVDFDAARIKQDLLLAILMLSGAGLIVLLTAIGSIGLMLNRSVLQPIKRLTEAAANLSLGQLSHRVPLGSTDEVGSLGRAFNAMAGRIQSAIREAEMREHYLQALIDAMPDAVRVIDTSYEVVKANAAFCDQQGRALSDVVGYPCYRSSHNLDSPCPVTLVTCPLHELQNSETTLTCRHRHVQSDGTEIPVEVSAAPFNIDVDGKQQRLIVEVIRDLSKEMRLSQEQRLSEIGFLAAGVAHEIHNPLASIHLGFDSARRAVEKKELQKAGDYLNVVDDQIARCIDVTSRLLRLSVAPSDSPELVNLTVAATEVLSLLNTQALKSNVDIVVDFPDQLRVIASDSELRMMVLNLAQNAIHAMPNGGRLIVSARRNDDRITLSFEDTGVGIAPEDLPRIFDPFWSRRADGVHGTGLGLPICNEFIKSNRGTIDVSSTLAKGTKFVVTLPSADAQEED